jgi:hypothetical protein
MLGEYHNAALAPFLSLHLRRDFQAQHVETDEACGVVLIAAFGWVGFHRGAVHVAKVSHLIVSSPLP